MTRPAKARDGMQPRPRIVILGSFRKHSQAITEVIEALQAADIEVLWPRLGKGFPVSARDTAKAREELERRALEDAIRRCSVVLVANFHYRGQPYLGLDTAFEIGCADRERKYIVSFNRITEAPAIASMVDRVMNPEELPRALREEPSSFLKAKVRDTPSRREAVEIIRASFGRRPDLPPGEEYVRRLKPVWAGLTKKAN